jgi:diguanylate cyclase (GGDEF)-like protein
MPSGLMHSRPALVLLGSSDVQLTQRLRGIFEPQALRVKVIVDGDELASAVDTLQATGLVLLDVRLSGADRLLARVNDTGVRRRCPVALIASKPTGEWLTRLREGAIDDIVPMTADAESWDAHLNTMRHGHQLHCELEHLNETALLTHQHDRVTGVLNRAAMMSVLFRETDRVQRLRGVLCVVVFDLDDFAQWNAELGRNSCDQLLREVTKRTGRILRTYDFMGRLGNDQFLLALPGCSTVNAVLLVERMRMEVFDEPFLLNSDHGEVMQVKLTACFGITSSRGRSPVVVLRESDHALTEAKLFGPGSIRCSSDSPLTAEALLSAAKLFPVGQAM